MMAPMQQRHASAANGGRRSWPWRRIGEYTLFAAVATAGVFAIGLIDVPCLGVVERAGLPRPGGFLDQFLDGLRNFGQWLTTASVAVLIAVYDRPRRRWVLTALLVGQALPWITYQTIKETVPRHRPAAVRSMLGSVERTDWAKTWDAPHGLDRAAESFPSGHSAAAFALAVVLARGYPPIAWLVWALAAGCAVSRVLHSEHWPSDCWAGAAIGIVTGRISLAIAARWLRPGNGAPPRGSP